MMLSKILITGFDPFGGESVNPAYEAVKLLPDTIAGAQVVKLEIPTVFTRSAEVLEQTIAAERPDAVICVGQAGGRSCVTVEQVAINLAEARIPDNDGEQPLGQPLRADGPAAYFATVPVKAMVAGIRAHHLPAFVSYTAGTFVCNSIMYHALYLCERRFPAPSPASCTCRTNPARWWTSPKAPRRCRWTPSPRRWNTPSKPWFAATRRTTRWPASRTDMHRSLPHRIGTQRIPVMESNNP